MRLKIESKQIGYWRQYETENSELPWPTEGRLPTETKELIAKFLNSGKELYAWRGFSTCRICGKLNGSVCLTKDNFIYPEGYAHYIVDHNIQPDLDLLVHVLSKNKTL